MLDAACALAVGAPPSLLTLVLVGVSICIFLFCYQFHYFFLFAEAMDGEDNTIKPSIPLLEAALPLVDWNSIKIQEEREEDTTIEICSEEQVDALLEFNHEDESEEDMARVSSSRDD